jgi:hypothetical protein
MDSEVIAVGGTLRGGILGFVATYINQAVGYQRESTERWRATQRAAYIDWLSCIDAMYGEIREATSTHRRTGTPPAQLVEQLQSVSPRAAQSSLEGLRIVATDSVAECAASLWTHMRRDAVPLGTDRLPEGWRRWQNQYWDLRRALLNAARADLGHPPLDWERAGVTPFPV